MSQAEFIGMMVICGSVLAGVLAAIYKPLTKNTETMTRLTSRIDTLIDRMDKQERALEKHEAEFEEYKKHVSESQRKQWDEINRHHDKLIEQGNDIDILKKGGV